MPYGDLDAPARAALRERAPISTPPHCTIEEREEYEPHLAAGSVVLRRRRLRAPSSRRPSSEADVILWDGGNNDFPFLRPDLHIVLVDALRPGHETHAPSRRGGAAHGRRHRRHQGRRRSAGATCGARGGGARAPLNPRAQIVRAAHRRCGSTTRPRCAASACWWSRTARRSPMAAWPTARLRRRRTARTPRASSTRARRPRRTSPPSTRSTRTSARAAGDGLRDCATGGAAAPTINAAAADVVVAGTPIDLAALLQLNKPVVRARYDFAELESPGLWSAVERALEPVLKKRP